MAKLGTITFQAMDKCDVFLQADVYLDGLTSVEEMAASLVEPGFDTNKAWVTGNVPGVNPVDVEGDSSVIYAWYMGKSYPGPFKLRVYVEYEEVDEMLKGEIK